MKTTPTALSSTTVVRLRALDMGDERGVPVFLSASVITTISFEAIFSSQ
jgi:hypothetical protein